MVALLALACSLNGSPAGFEQSTIRQAPDPNWTQATPDELREGAEADAASRRSPSAGEVAFTFTLSENARATSAGVYDAQGKLLRTLWSARPYSSGPHRALWDGRDDYGNQASAGSYTIKLLAGNVHYDWDGVIGVTEDSLAGPDNWDATASFPTSMAFINGKAYVSGGYNEGKIEAYVFDEKTPGAVAPLNPALFSGGQFDFASTDGKRVYFAANHYWWNASNAVVGFTPDGQPYSFPQGAEIPAIGHLGGYFVNTRTRPYIALKGVRGVDVANFKDTSITGLAVERNGNLLASAHGAHGGARMTASLDAIFLFDKNTGAQVGKVEGIHSPQKMAFDAHNDLWVIEGGPVVDWYWDSGARLARVHDIGGKNEITEPFQGLENPVDVAVNPVNGHIFVADGGSSQQVKEFDPATGRLVSTLGTKGGYGQGAACNATITPTTFWLDFNGRSTGYTHPWIAVDEGGDVWVGDFTSNRMLRFHDGRLIDRIEMARWLYPVTAPSKSPTRVFGGWNGMLEYDVNYSVPLAPSDPLDPRAPHSWRPVRNWYPCFLQAEKGQQDSVQARLLSTETLSNGQTYGLINYHGGPFGDKNALVHLPESGKIAVANNRVTVFKIVGMDADGNYYRVTHTGPPEMPTYTIRQFRLTGFDARNFPTWDDGSVIATLTADLKKGNPYPGCSAEHCVLNPTTGGIIPIYGGTGFNHVVAPGEPAFHLGGLPFNGNSLLWQAMPEKPIRYPDGRGTYSALKNQNEANEARAIGRDIFAGVNGNWQHFSCQYFHYREDGLLVGQFGWRGSDAYPGQSLGRPDPFAGQALAPGFCGNPLTFKVVPVGKDYYLYNADEGYRAGIHRWHIWNLDSIREYAGTASQGATMQLAEQK